MSKRVDSVFHNKRIEINKWMDEKIPSSTICKRLNVSLLTFRTKFPAYKGNQGYNSKRLLKDIHLKETRKCERCGKEFTIDVFTKSKSPSLKRFCTKSCGRAKAAESRVLIQYRTIAKRHFGVLKCCVCGFDKIVDIHHHDHNHKNNNPRNLIPLCPNHHRMYHSCYSDEVKPIIESFIKDFA